MRRRAPLCLVTALAFLAYTVCGLTMGYAAPKVAVVEVKPGTLTGKLTGMDEKPLEGKTVKVLDGMGKIKHMATSDENGAYTIENLAAGNYTMIVADSQKVSLVVKPEANSTIINAMLPQSSQPYSAGAIAGLAAPLVIAIAGGAVLVGVAAYGVASYDSNVHDKVTPASP